VSTSFEVIDPIRFTTGAVGDPGARTFFIQATYLTERAEQHTLSLKLEKQQVAALCEYLAGILADLPAPESPLPDDLDLVEPVVAEWTVGTLAVAYEQAGDRIVLVAEELQLDDELDEESVEVFSDPATARFVLQREQVAAFIEKGASSVSAGRPTCRLCGRPIDPDGHHCPRLN
jgi:uncharacterized repeat protein (TIGR03847 family)